MVDGSRAPRWRDIDILTVLVLYALGLLIFFSVQSLLLGSAPFDQIQKNTVRFLLEEFLDACLLAFLPIFFVVKVYGAELREIGLSSVQLLRQAVVGAASGLLLYGAVAIVEWITESAFGVRVSPPYLEILEGTSSFTPSLPIYLSIVLLPP